MKLPSILELLELKKIFVLTSIVYNFAIILRHNTEAVNFEAKTKVHEQSITQSTDPLKS